MVASVVKGFPLRWAGFFMAVICGCGIFTPRDSESPEQSGRLDPLNFSAIMTGTNEQFTKLRYEDLFSDAVQYEDINSGVYGKTQLIQRLNQIKLQYPAIKVEWAPGDQWRRGDTIILSSLQYRIVKEDNGSEVPDETGTSNFTVVKNWEWNITQWRDVPGNPAKSFFSP